MKQEPELVKIAPIDDLDGFIERMKIKYRAKSALRKTDSREIQFEPSLDEILKELPAYYMKNVVYHLALDAKASEQSARMVAMQGASDNAESLIASLTLEYNKARQAAITTEITEIAAAAAASGQ